MKISTSFKPVIAASVFLLAASQTSLVQADNGTGYYQGAQPQAGQGYGSTDNLTPGYSQPYYQGGNYGGGNSMPWNGGNGNSMPWSGGRGGNGPGFSGPWDSGNGNSMPWNSGRGNGMSW